MWQRGMKYFLDFNPKCHRVAFKNGVNSKPVMLIGNEWNTLVGESRPDGTSISYYKGYEVPTDGATVICTKEKTRRLKDGRVRIYGIGFYILS